MQSNSREIYKKHIFALLLFTSDRLMGIIYRCIYFVIESKLAIITVSQCLRHKCNIVRIHGNVSEYNLGGNTNTGDNLSDMVWKMPVEQDICHRFLKRSVVISIPPLFYEKINDHKPTKTDHFSNCATISRSFGYFSVYHGIRMPDITSPSLSK